MVHRALSDKRYLSLGLLFLLSNVLLVPSYPQDIFSVQAATENRTRVNFRPQSAELIHTIDAKFKIEKR